MDKLERIFGIQKDFTEKFFKDKHGLTIDDVVKDIKEYANSKFKKPIEDRN